MTSALTRIGFSLLDRVAPGVAAAGVEHRLLTVPKPPLQADRDRVINPGEPFEVQYGADVLVRGQLWGGGPHVHLIHEWGGWHQQLGAQIAPLLAGGMQVLGHDALGHGETPAGLPGMHQARLTDLVDSFTAVAHAHGPVHGAIAHGTGALAALGAIRDGLRVRRLALINPVLGLESVLRRLQLELGYGDATSAEVARRLDARDDTDWELGTLGSRLGEPPALFVVVDRDDPDSPIAEVEALVAGWPGAETMITSGLGHDRPIWDGEVVSRVSEFLLGGSSTGPGAHAAAE